MWCELVSGGRDRWAAVGVAVGVVVCGYTLMEEVI